MTKSGFPSLLTSPTAKADPYAPDGEIVLLNPPEPSPKHIFIGPSPSPCVVIASIFPSIFKSEVTR